MKLVSQSAQDYLEAILMLKKEKGYVRAIDIATHLSYSKPSVSIALKNLREEGLVIVDDKGMISLTPEGKRVASQVYERHIILSKWFEHMGVPRDVALEDACKIEHNLSQITFEKLKVFLGNDFLQFAMENADNADLLEYKGKDKQKDT